MSSKQVEYTGAAIYAEPLGFKFTVHLDEAFAEKGDYRSVLNLLAEASENDTAVFLLNNHGGNLDIILPLINMLELTSAQTVAICTGSQSSAATIFAMYCDELIAMPHSQFMIHEMQTGHCGTMSNVIKDVASHDNRNKRLIEEAYGGFLSDDEIKDVLRGVEIYLADSEINERFVKRKEWRENFFAQKQQEAQERLESVLQSIQAVDAELEEVVESKPKRTRKPKQ